MEKDVSEEKSEGVMDSGSGDGEWDELAYHKWHEAKAKNIYLCKATGMNQEVDSTGKMMNIAMSDLWVWKRSITALCR